MTLTLKVWRQENTNATGRIETYEAKDIPVECSFLEMLDIVNEDIISSGGEPIHFDHDAARRAGLEGIVVHGLLMTAWGLQAVSLLSARPDPVAQAKIRFRNPLRPAASATVIALIGDEAPDGADSQVGLKIMGGETQLVGATCVARLDG